MNKYKLGFYVREIQAFTDEVVFKCEPIDGWLLRCGDDAYALLKKTVTSKSSISPELIPLKQNLEKSGEETFLFSIKMKGSCKFCPMLMAKWSTAILEVEKKKIGPLSILGGPELRQDYGQYDVSSLCLK